MLKNKMASKKIIKNKEEKPSYKKLKEYDIRKGLYPLRVTLTIWDDGKSKPVIDLYSGVPPKGKGEYKHNHVKITSNAIWNKIRKIIDEDFVKSIKKGNIISERIVEKQIDEEIERLKEDNLRMKKTVQAHSKLIKEYRKIKLPDYSNDIKELEVLIKKANSEKELQKFLSKRPWLLGLEYENSVPQKIAPGQRYDFYVEKYDGYADIIEIKKVNEDVFDKKGKITSVFSRAIQQLIEYIDDALIHGDSKRLSKKMDFNFLKPKGILIIGKNADPEKLKNLEFYFHNIEILTYDNVLERGKNILERLQIKSKKKSKK